MTAVISKFRKSLTWRHNLFIREYRRFDYHQCGLSNFELCLFFDFGYGNFFLVDVCAVGASQISQKNLVKPDLNGCVFPGDLFVWNYQVHFSPAN